MCALEAREIRTTTPTTIRIADDLEVPRLGYGAMRITGKGIWGPPADEARAIEVLREVVRLGVRFIDTADSYGPDVSERLIAEALHPYPDDLVIATKGGLVRPGPGRWEPDGRPEHLRNALMGSLVRLRLERVDVYQLHSPDPDVPFEDSVNELARLRDEGKIRNVGVSNVSVEELEEARSIVPIVSVQNEYNLAERGSEDVLERCEQLGIAFIPWFPLDTGELARPGGPVDEMARRLDAKPSQVALAWLLRRAEVMLPIPGTSSVEHLRENVDAWNVRMSDEDFDALDRMGRD